MNKMAVDFLKGRKTFYAKKWQQNGFYPISKFEWNEKENAWEEFDNKESGWLSRGCVFSEPAQVGAIMVTNFSWWAYIFENNAYILSYNEMKDERNYNDK